MPRFSRAAVHFGRMDLQIKLLQWEDREYYLIVIGRGELNRESLKELFHKLTEAIRTNQDCKILVDLQDVTTVMSSSNIDALLDESKVSFVRNTIVFVCPEESRQYFLLIALSTSLTKLGHNVAVFSDAKTAADWLRGSPKKAQRRQRPATPFGQLPPALQHKDFPDGKMVADRAKLY